MKLQHILCAEHVIVDARTDKISAINLLSQVNEPKYPAMLPYVALMAIFVREPGEPEQATFDLVLTQGGESSAPQPIPVRFRGESARQILAIDGLIVNAPGTLSLAFRWQGQELGAWTIDAQVAGEGIEV